MVGDVNSTMAAALAAVKMHIPVAHVEAGLRSSDRSMPEEINRIVTDSISDMLFVSEPSGMTNLRREGRPEEGMHLVGNVMIDTLLRLLPKAAKTDVLKNHGLHPGQYGVVTLHRPGNVDQPGDARPDPPSPRGDVSRPAAVFPIHPRTMQRIERFGLAENLRRAPGDSRIAAARLSGFPGPDFSVASDRYRFGRTPGGIHGIGDPLPHHASQHRAADHRRGRHQHSRGKRSRSIENDVCGRCWMALTNEGAARRSGTAKPRCGSQSS